MPWQSYTPWGYESRDRADPHDATGFRIGGMEVRQGFMYLVSCMGVVHAPMPEAFG